MTTQTNFTPEQLAQATRTILWQRYLVPSLEPIRDDTLPEWDGLRDAALIAAHNAELLSHNEGFINRGDLEPDVESLAARQIMATILSDLDSSSPRRDDHWDALRREHGDAAYNAAVQFLHRPLGLIKIRDGLVHDAVPGRREMMSTEPTPEPTNEINVPAPESAPETTKPSTMRAPARRRETKPVAAPAAPAVTTPANPTLASIDRTLQQLTSVLTVGVGRGMLSGISPSADTDTYELNRRVLAQQIAVWLDVYGALTRSDLAQGKVSHDQRQMLRDALDWGVLQGAFSVSSPRRGRYTLITPTPLGLTAEAFQERVEAQRAKDAEKRARFGARVANDNITAARDRVLAR